MHFLVIGIGKLSNIIFHVEKPKTPGYAVEVSKLQLCLNARNSCEEKVDIAALMAMGDVAVVKKFLKNVLHVTQLIKVEKIKLVQHFIMLLGEKLGDYRL